MLTQPFVDKLSKSKNVLIAGAGGGMDVFCGLPLFFALTAAGKSVHLANFSFAEYGKTNAMVISQNCHFVTHKTETHSGYYPEKLLADWLYTSGFDTEGVYCVTYSGVVQTTAAYQQIIYQESIDTIILVDGGMDILMRGDEPGLGSPLEDMTSLGALSAIPLENKLVCCVGFGIDSFDGVCHTYALEAIADFTKEGNYLGSISYLKLMPEVEQYLAATRYVVSQLERRKSIVNASIISAIDGEFGNHHTTERTANSELFINPLMNIAWFMDLDSVAKRVLYLESILQTQTQDETIRFIQSFRKSIGNPKPFKELPF